MEHDVVESEVVESDIDIKDLMSKYNETKASASVAVSSLTDSFTLEGMDSINTLVSEAMGQIQTFVQNGSKKSTVNKITSKALAVIDPNNTWAGKWLNSTKDVITEQNLKQKTINEIIDTLIAKIMEKREEVLQFIEKTSAVKLKMLEDIEQYKSLLEQTNQIITTSEDQNSREVLDAEMLTSMLQVSIQGLDTDLRSQIDPLIASARLSCNKIAAILPTIENDLKYKTGFKAFQQQLSDLNGMLTTTVGLATNAGDIIRSDVNKTIRDSMLMITENGLDPTRLEKIQKEQAEHQQLLMKTLDTAQAKMKDTFSRVNQLYVSYDNTAKQNTHKLLEEYSEV